jgi:hypothetical protein
VPRLAAPAIEGSAAVEAAGAAVADPEATAKQCQTLTKIERVLIRNGLLIAERLVERSHDGRRRLRADHACRRPSRS